MVSVYSAINTKQKPPIHPTATDRNVKYVRLANAPSYKAQCSFEFQYWQGCEGAISLIITNVTIRQHPWSFNIRGNIKHQNDVIMGTIASQTTSLTIVYSAVYSDADQGKHQSSASLAFVRGIHREPVNSPHKWPVTQKLFPFDDVIMKQLNQWRCLSHCEVRLISKRSYFCRRRHEDTYTIHIFFLNCYILAHYRQKYWIFRKHYRNTHIWHFDLLEMARHQTQTSIVTLMQLWRVVSSTTIAICNVRN